MSDISRQEWEAEYTRLIREMQKEQCVLLIGPDFYTVKGQTLEENLSGYLRTQFPAEINHYYARDNFFLFKDDKLAKPDVQAGVADYFQQFTPDDNPADSLLKKVAALPFHLVVSINPDNFLSQTFSSYGIRHRRAFFHHAGSGVDQVEEPRSFYPLLYNLCGSVEKEGSLVLDYNDLFSLLRTLLGTPGLPSKLRAKLSEARSFVFLGFDIERWYSQLLLKLLAGEQAIRSYVFENEPEPQSQMFLANQFGIKFLGSNLDFFNGLYVAAEKATQLRSLVEIKSASARDIFQLIQIGDVGRAVQNLLQICKGTDFETEANMISSRYNLWIDSRENIPPADAQIQLNQIIYAILQLANQLTTS